MPKPQTRGAVTSTSIRSYIDRHAANCERIREIADLCAREQRERNEAENTEYATLVRENQLLEMQAQAMQYRAANPASAYSNADTVVRETLAGGGRVTIELRRESITTGTENLNESGIIRVSQQDMIKPLRAGIIYDKLGLKVLTGQIIGQPMRWPKHGKATATFVDEGVAAADSTIDFSKLDAQPRRLVCPVSVTREALEASEGVVESIVREEIPNAIIERINEALLTTDGTGRKVYGPLVEAAKTPVQFAGAVPTRKELLKMKAKVAKSGITFVAPCFVMTEDMKAELEATPVDAGSGRFLCENDRVLGYPVFTSPAIGSDFVAFGDWSYQAAAFYGPMNIIADPYTGLRKNVVDFVLNTHFATATLCPEAFVVGKVKTA